MLRVLTFAVLAALQPWSTATADPLCGAAQTPCEIDGGSYHMAVPEGWDGASPLPAIVFFHGHRSSGKSVLKGSIQATFGTDYAIIAPNGPKSPRGDYRFWPARPQTDPIRDNIAFLEAVVADAADRVALDRGRILVGGFSAGGSMAWRVACQRGGAFAGYVSVAGALRRPVPDDGCPGGPANLLHIHGFNDAQVPFEGRQIRDWHQGDVFESLGLIRAANACRSNPHVIEVGAPFSCRRWNACASGAEVELCLHDGGHGLPKGWAAHAKSWFEELPDPGPTPN
ncbi:MAG: polyhydroxybutyrate depolymerase [Pseudomonadota bacterium]